MTTRYGQGDRSHESILNAALARLWAVRGNLDAVAETLQGRRRPDIIVRRTNGPVIVETEFVPAATVEADALSRLGMEIDGRTVQNVFAVSVPTNLRTTNQNQLPDRLAATQLTWREWRIDGTSGPWLTGTALDLAEAVRRVTAPPGNLDEAVDLLEKGAKRAGAHLYARPGTLDRTARVFDAYPNDEAANMAGLVIINAMVFQERLASVSSEFSPVTSAMSGGAFSRIKLLQAWDHILSIDYYPIFQMARDVLAGIASSEDDDLEAYDILRDCANTAEALLGLGVVGQHDLAGRTFNRLVAERKLLAAYYTSVPASIILAGLALAPERWSHVSWGEAKDISAFSIVDPACGTGTLLMAAYRQIVQNHASSVQSQNADSTIHNALVEKVILGTDVVSAAIHMTASTLAAMSPTVRFENMDLHTLKYGMDDGAIHFGSLDWLVGDALQSSVSMTRESMQSTGSAAYPIPRPTVNLVISNPPYIRRGSDGGKGEALARVFDIPEGDEKSRQAIAQRTSTLLRGTAANQMAGHGSSFTVLADRLVKPGGRIALVLPVTALFGESWRAVRAMLAERYEIEFVVSSHDPETQAMSYDTKIAETLVVARRLTDEEQPSGRGRFVNLWRAAGREIDALAIVNAINAVAQQPTLHSDGPPVGGTALMVGGEQWGEVVYGPVGEDGWTGARWRRALTGQIAIGLKNGYLANPETGGSISGRLPIAPMAEVADVGPDHRVIRGANGAFDGFHGRSDDAQFPALWSLDSRIHNGLIAEPNAWLVPKPNRRHEQLWARSGTLQLAGDVRYTSQPILAVRTPIRSLGVSSWFSARARNLPANITAAAEIVLTMWLNSTLGLLLNADHANRTQQGRGRGNRGMLETLHTLDVRHLQQWQLDAADSIWRDFQGRTFEAFYRCAVDRARIELDERLVRDVLGLGEDAVAAVAQIRELLAREPSIHGSKEPALPANYVSQSASSPIREGQAAFGDVGR